MKVISGFLKGRNVEGFNLSGTRPTMDRVKESLFATIQMYIPNSVVLDLFAGSGNLGIEAISNGANEVYFNDYNKEAIKVLNKNLSNFNVTSKSVVLNKDYNKALEDLKSNNIKFDVIFLDPPYKDEILNEVVSTIIKYDLLSKDAIIVCEVSNDYIKSFDLLDRVKTKKYGDKYIVILQKK